jgi:wyosine [tRNA(Phe)-imidazoG37] synthetase (radical SAM superfamily)
MFDIYNKLNYSRITAKQLIPENLYLFPFEKYNRIFQVEIDPIDYCNHNCKWCFTSDFRFNKKIPLIDLKNYLSYFIKFSGKSIVFSGGGEPLLYKEIYTKSNIFENKSICKFLIDKAINIGIITNGTLLDKLLKADFEIRELSFIRISLDATNADTHSTLHQTTISDYYKILNSISKLIKLRGNSFSPAIGISFVVDSFNGINYYKHQIAEINEIATYLNVDFVQFKHIHTSDKNSANKSMENVHSHCKSFNWNNTEFWVQTYDSANKSKVCLITKYIQSIGKDSKKFPCCHLFGQEKYLDQTHFKPKGKVIQNCNNNVCRYNEMNKLLLSNSSLNIKYNKQILEKSIKNFGFHPYRLFPTAPNLLKPYK